MSQSRFVNVPNFILPLLPGIDPYELSAVFDMDDFLWPYFNAAAKSIGADPSKLDNFVVRHSPYYTTAEKDKFFQAFVNAELFKQIEFYPGIEKISILYELGIKIGINSKSSSEEVTEVKRIRIKDALSFLQDSDLTLFTAHGDQATTGKQIGADTTFFGDDNPYNIITSNATYNLLLRQPWNINATELHRMRDKNFYIFNSLDDLLETIIRSVRFWRSTI